MLSYCCLVAWKVVQPPNTRLMFYGFIRYTVDLFGILYKYVKEELRKISANECTTDEPLSRWYTRLLRNLMFAAGSKYDEEIALRKKVLLSCLQEDQRVKRVLELGIGVGGNVPLYARQETIVLGVDPHPELYNFACQHTGARHPGVTVVKGAAEALPVEDSSQDAVVCILTLCSVQNPAVVMQEVKRVLKPGGRFVFLEHTAAKPGTLLRRLQDCWNNHHTVAFDGCNCNRDIAAVVNGAGFANIHIDAFTVTTPCLWVISQHILGYATC